LFGVCTQNLVEMFHFNECVVIETSVVSKAVEVEDFFFFFEKSYFYGCKYCEIFRKWIYSN